MTEGDRVTAMPSPLFPGLSSSSLSPSRHPRHPLPLKHDEVKRGALTNGLSLQAQRLENLVGSLQLNGTRVQKSPANPQV